MIAGEIVTILYMYHTHLTRERTSALLASRSCRKTFMLAFQPRPLLHHRIFVTLSFFRVYCSVSDDWPVITEGNRSPSSWEAM